MGTINDLRAEIERLREENARLREALDRAGVGDDANARLDAWAPTLFAPEESAGEQPSINARSDPAAKIELFRSLFIGRDDVYATRWDNARSGKSGWSPAVRGGALNAKRPDREYLPLTDAVIDAHLRGDIHAGLYPLLRSDRCLLLVADFDGPAAMLDAAAYADAARVVGLPVAVERSRSGDGAHAWMFFAGAVPASAARRVGAYLLREAMAARAELDLGSYDRMFPAQDFVPTGSFGNLIALPLHGASRKKGRTVFVDARAGEPVADQWAFLASVGRVPAASILSLAESVSMVAAGPDTRVYRAPRDPLRYPVPPEVHAAAGAMLAIDRIGMPPAVVAALKHLASLHNPEYYEKERLRLSTWRTPRFIRCYGETLDQLLLPRGLRVTAGDVLREAGSRLVVAEGAAAVPSIDARLSASLSPEQSRAAEAVLACELGRARGAAGVGQDGGRLRGDRAARRADARDRRPPAARAAVARAFDGAPGTRAQADRRDRVRTREAQGRYRHRDGAVHDVLRTGEAPHGASACRSVRAIPPCPSDRTHGVRPILWGGAWQGAIPRVAATP